MNSIFAVFGKGAGLSGPVHQSAVLAVPIIISLHIHSHCKAGQKNDWQLVCVRMCWRLERESKNEWHWGDCWRLWFHSRSCEWLPCVLAYLDILIALLAHRWWCIYLVCLPEWMKTAQWLELPQPSPYFNHTGKKWLYDMFLTLSFCLFQAAMPLFICIFFFCLCAILNLQ